SGRRSPASYRGQGSWGSWRRLIANGCAMTHAPAEAHLCRSGPGGAAAPNSGRFLDALAAGHYTVPASTTRIGLVQGRRGFRRVARQFEGFAMSRRCDLTGKAPQTGHKVSHSNRKSKRRFLPNLCNVTFISDTLNRSVRLRVSANAVKSVDHRGGLDAFLMKVRDEELSPEALDLKREIAKKRAVSSA